MPHIDGTSPEGLTRREALKRGAAFGGALLWATPVVQAIGMSRALAEGTSGNCKTYCIKFEFTGGDDDLSGSWSELGNGRGNCLVCPTGVENGSLPASFFSGFQVTGDRKTGVYVRYPNTCALVKTDSSPDELAQGNVAAKCGTGLNRCNYQDPIETPVGNTTEIKVEPCGPLNKAAISHIEMIIRCCP